MKTLIIVASLPFLLVGSASGNSNCPNPDNVVVNCGFDIDDFTGWFFGEGTPYYDAANGANAPGSMCVNATDDGGTWIIHLGYCSTGFADGADYAGGFSYRQEAGGPLFNTYLELSQRPQTNCGGSPSSIHLIPDVLPDATWHDIPTVEMTTTSSSGGLGLIAYFESASPFVVCFDDAYKGIDLEPVGLIFRDDFDDGTPDAWTIVAP